jgi:hypothetical protein
MINYFWDSILAAFSGRLYAKKGKKRNVQDPGGPFMIRIIYAGDVSDANDEP